MSDLIGQSLGNYQIVSVIGEGGMGTVYLGEHRTLRRKAAVKVLKRQYAADASMVKRFVEEARAASAVAHPNIVDIYDVGTLTDGLPFMLMEYLNGESLARRLARVGRLGPGRGAVDHHPGVVGAGGGPRPGRRPPRSEARQPVPGARCAVARAASG